jgi:hypothetical protein
MKAFSIVTFSMFLSFKTDPLTSDHNFGSW